MLGRLGSPLAPVRKEINGREKESRDTEEHD
jgi:hypothetical protein